MQVNRKYLFAESVQDKSAYRLIEVVASTESDARSQIGHTLGVAYLACLPIRTAGRGVRTRLFRDVEKWRDFLDRYFLTQSDVDRRITLAK